MTKGRTARFIGAALVLGALAACSGSNKVAVTEVSTTTAGTAPAKTVPDATIESTTTSTTTTTPTTPATTTTIDPVKAAATKYIELVTPLNCANELLTLVINEASGDDYLTDSEWARAQPGLNDGYRAAAERTLEFMNALLAYDWPDDVQGDVDALVAEAAGDAGIYQSLADALTFDAFLAVEPFPAATAATVLRAKLGLESNVGGDAAYCESFFAE